MSLHATAQRRSANDNTGEAGCPSDERLETSPDAGAPKLPICALRTVYPPVEAVEKHSLDENQRPESSTEYQHEEQVHRRDRFTIQRNKMASRDKQTHVVTWSYLDDVRADSDEGLALEEAGRGRESGDGSFVRDLRLGDVVTVWGMARFPMWQNKIKSVKLEVYWAV